MLNSGKKFAVCATKKKYCSKTNFLSKKKPIAPPPHCTLNGRSLNAIVNNISIISWLSALLVEETGVLGENNVPVASH